MVGTKKELGQHWLKNRLILDEIASLAGEGELCVEIGPGLGFLTSSLLKRFNKVIAVEYDERLANNLPKSFPGKNLEVVWADFLQYDLNAISKPYTVVGNIPYYITSPIIEKVLSSSALPSRVVLLMQKEVAERITDKKETVLSLFVKNRATVTAGLVVPAAEFTPPPKVDSQVLVMEPHRPIVSEEVFEMIRRGFKAPRKKLIHNLAALRGREELEKIMSQNGIDLNARPADLTLQAWQKLFDAMK